MNILRRLPLSRLLLACAIALAVGVSATALAFAVDSGPTPRPKPLADAIHDALEGAREAPVQGVSASITLTDHLLEGASLASGGQSGGLTSSPLVTGASGRLWIANNGHMRIELQSQKGDTQVLYDGHTLSLYDAATNTLYRYTPHARRRGSRALSPEGGQPSGTAPANGQRHVPTVAHIEEAISRLSKHADVSAATPTDVAGQPAYTVRLSPNEGGSLFGGVGLSFDANNGLPLRAAVYSSASSAPVIELAATEISFGPVSESIFELSPPPSAKVEQLILRRPHRRSASGSASPGGQPPKLTTFGKGPSTIAVLESKASAGSQHGGASEALEALPKVSIDGAGASELRTELGTLLVFQRSSIRYLLAGSVTPAQIEAVARGL